MIDSVKNDAEREEETETKVRTIEEGREEE